MDRGATMNRVLPDDLNNVQLAQGVTVRIYREWVATEDRTAIAGFIRSRFMDRYITPVKGTSRNQGGYSSTSSRSGFAMMAISCLMIEALEAFRQGLPNTRNRSREMFSVFFRRVSQFSAFSPYADSFYYDVRCGILHQAEVQDGWLIRRDCIPSDPANKVINAEEFIGWLEDALHNYCDELTSASWQAEIWINLRRKMDSVIANSRRSQS